MVPHILYPRDGRIMPGVVFGMALPTAIVKCLVLRPRTVELVNLGPKNKLKHMSAFVLQFASGRNLAQKWLQDTKNMLCRKEESQTQIMVSTWLISGSGLLKLLAAMLLNLNQLSRKMIRGAEPYVEETKEKML